MIFLTVGTHLPFERLVRTIDAWCAEHPAQQVFGQIGDPGRHGYRPRHFNWQPFLDPSEAQARFDASDIIIAHAGMGTIITALLKAKPVVILPRRVALGEHRNDHQYATAQEFSARALVYAATSETEIPAAVEAALAHGNATAGAGEFAEDRLLHTLRDFIHAPRQGTTSAKQLWLQRDLDRRKT